MRAFVAIALPEEVRAALTGLQRQLATSGADVKWASPDQLHLTLRFLGDITQEQRDAVEHLLATVAVTRPPFPIRLEGVGAFPSIASPRVVWVAVREGRTSLLELAGALEEGIRALGCSAEERPFAAHVTLGRVRSPRRRTILTERLRTAAWSPPSAWPVDAVRLYQSVLSPAGPHYTVLADVPLTGR